MYLKTNMNNRNVSSEEDCGPHMHDTQTIISSTEQDN